MKRIAQFIADKNLLAKNDTVLAAVSGGPDSLLLLYVLADLRAEYNLTLTVIHINHQLRGETAAKEAEFVGEMCRQWHIPYRIVSENVSEYAQAHHLSEEAAGHEVRYRIFAEEMRRLNADKLALGHHLNDRAESVLMHIIKGCSPAGLAVLKAKEGKIIRPLLPLNKQEIENLCAEMSISYCTDLSNHEPICLRNHLRLELLPYLRREYNPEIDRALVQLSELAVEDEDYLNAVTEKCAEECAFYDGEQAQIDLSRWQKYHPTLKRRLLQNLWQKMSGEQKLSFAQVENILALAEDNSGEKRLCLAGGWQFIKTYEHLILTKQDKSATEAYQISWERENESIELPSGTIFCEMREIGEDWQAEKKAYQATVDADKLCWPLLVRNRRAGDRMRPLGSGEKKLKDILIDKKIPLARRDELPLVISGGKIVWAAGVAVSEEYKVTAETERTITFTFERKN